MHPSMDVSIHVLCVLSHISLPHILVSSSNRNLQQASLGFDAAHQKCCCNQSSVKCPVLTLLQHESFSGLSDSQLARILPVYAVWYTLWLEQKFTDKSE